jgi:acetyltransferase-like isoleucine patch superfamily enzyme
MYVKILAWLYKKIRHVGMRRVVLKKIARVEGGQIYSSTIRVLFNEVHQVDIGLYTHGGCFDPRLIDPMTTIGRYCSFGLNVRVITANHPMHFKSTHVFFFNPGAGFCKRVLSERSPLTIGHDVWIGDGAIIHPHVQCISDGAVIGAGAVVTKNIPPYAVVVGNPARIVRYRFTPDKIKELIESKWWEKSIEEIAPVIDEYTCALEASEEIIEEQKSRV